MGDLIQWVGEIQGGEIWHSEAVGVGHYIYMAMPAVAMKAVSFTGYLSSLTLYLYDNIIPKRYGIVWYPT